MLPSARDTALQPLSKLQWGQCCEISGVLCLGKPQVKREVTRLNTHTLLLQFFSAKMMNRLKQKLQQTEHKFCEPKYAEDHVISF